MKSFNLRGPIGHCRVIFMTVISQSLISEIILNGQMKREQVKFVVISRQFPFADDYSATCNIRL